MGTTSFDPLSTLIRLDGGGNAHLLERSAAGWRIINRADGERVVGMSEPKAPADLHPQSWEMHPEGDEVLHLVAGSIDLILDEAAGESRVRLEAGSSCVVERGAWHCLLLREPSRLLFITPAGGTRMRPRETQGDRP
jgi:mannose-6-phosphate isomerase-like protein (cupin superfamily)